MAYFDPTDQKRLESYRFSSRKPVRVTSTIPWSAYQQLIERSTVEGRSLSNLIAHILEVGVTETT